MKTTPTILILSVYCLSTFIEAHVRLSFPKARYPNLDFLDNVRTEGPCGVKKNPNAPRTTLEAGKSFFITWDLRYAHQGGYKLEILDSNDRKIRDLTGGRFIKTSKYKAHFHKLTLPAGFECENCAIRLVREAKEFSAGPGRPYLFWSCGDVDIVQNPSRSDYCGDNGAWSNGGCKCNNPYFGKQCQYQLECITQTECGPNGACCPLKPKTFPQQAICICNPGFHGKTCEKRSSLTKSFNPSEYQVETVGRDNDRIYWRVLRDLDEIEMIAQFKGTSWIGIGWKEPNQKCSLPRFGTAVLSRTKRQAGISEPEPYPETEGGWPEPEPATESEPEPEAEGKSKKGKGHFGSHPMDCADIVIGFAQGEKSHVGDYYTVSRATPEKDEFYGGGQSLTGAMAFEEDGVTTVMFRKKMTASDKADNSITSSSMFIWAKGQKTGLYEDHAALRPASKKVYYEYDQDILRYHGTKNRGLFFIDIPGK